MRKKSINLTLSLGCRWLFFLIPTIEFDWDSLYGYTRITWLWFFLEFYHWNTGIDPITKEKISNSNICNSQHTTEQTVENSTEQNLG